MILASLARYYRRLAAETDEMGNPKVPPYGFSEEKIGWIWVLDKEGRLKTVVPNLTADKKPQPKLMSVPRPEKRTSGIKPNFLWDKTAYALGVEANKNKVEAKEKHLRRLKKLLTPLSNIISIYCKTVKMKACKPCAVFCKTGSLHISLPKIFLPKYSMPTSYFLLKNRPHLSINAKPRKLCGQVA
ncbi:CRISPR-associated protein, Csd1 family [Neisseria flavescens]|nr:CRISPR-associated protein, Csd1 family [Neisseria flavescens]